MFKAVLIVDDEPLALDRLERLLKNLGIERIYRAESSFTAKEILNSNLEIKVVFLDIKMPGKTGLELAEELQRTRDDLVIILQTAYPDYALEGFRVGAISYLVKPYTLEELHQALIKAKRYLGEEETLHIMVETLRGERTLLNLNEIIYVKADLKHSLIRTKDEFYFCRLSIGDLERKLNRLGFIRPHRSYLVNLAMVKSIEEASYGKLVIKFKYPIEDLTTSKAGASLIRQNLKRLKKLENKND